MIKYSVIFSIGNGGQTLHASLDSLIHQTVPRGKYEILVVDTRGSKNATAPGEEMKKKYPEQNIRYFNFNKERVNPIRAVNQMIKEATGEIIFFTGDDYAAPEGWMEMVIKGYRQHPDAALVGGAHDTASCPEGYLQRSVDALHFKLRGFISDAELETNFFNQDTDIIRTHPGNISFRKSLWEEIGGLDENMLSFREAVCDLKIRVLAAGYSLLHIRNPVKIIRPLRLKSFCRQCFRGGRDIYYLSLKYPALVVDAYKFSFYHFFRLLTLASFRSFYAAYFLSDFFYTCGRFQARYWTRPAVKEMKLLWSKNLQMARINETGEMIKMRAAPFKKGGFFGENGPQVFCSVVIPTYNRLKMLTEALTAVLNQKFPSGFYEVIIVDDGSTVSAQEAVSELKQRYPQHSIRYFYQQNSGPAAARNRGIKEARGEIIFFTDDDCVVPADWLETLLSGYRRYPEAAGVGGWFIPPKNELEKNAISRFLYFKDFLSSPASAKLLLESEILSNDPLMCFSIFAYNTANVSYKKEVIQEAGGFRENFDRPGYEDNDLALRIMRAGHSLLYLPFHVMDARPKNLAGFIKNYFQRGANGYLFMTMNRGFLERSGLAPDEYGSMANFIRSFNGPEKFLAFLGWMSFNAGIMRMKYKLERGVVAGKAGFFEHFYGNPVLTQPSKKAGDN